MLTDHVNQCHLNCDSTRLQWLGYPALLILAVSAFGISCGKRKPPLPPTPKVVQRAEISGFQRGGRVILSWKMPERNAAATNVQHIRRIDVYRLTERLAAPLTMSEEEFASRSVVIASVKVKDSDFGTKPFTYSDPLQFAGQPARLRYAIRFVNASGQKAAFSNFLVIEPQAKVAEAPASLRAETGQDAVKLKWNAPQENTDGTTPVNLLGYNIYRSDSKGKPGTRINTDLLSSTEFSDTKFEFDQEYFYFVRAVSSAGGDAATESAESNIVEVTPKDIFPPSAPTAITIAASPGSISLFFPPNPEQDVIGYKVLRSDDEAMPKAEWKVLTPAVQDANTFEDTTVEAGKTYFYYVVAVDKFGNMSEPSEVVSEMTQ